ncbi:MAG: choice-of-anchor J domain-containing protein [Muribaculaceae bacterium]|nr:choice-of-anchor J domain-containing protein [Muribaculaceae bacterium]
MKAKFTIFMLTAALALTAGAQGLKKDVRNTEFKLKARTTQVETKSIAPTVKKAKVNADIPAGQALVTLRTEDVWGDGSGYQLLLGQGLVSATTFDELYNNITYSIPDGADYDPNSTNIVFNDSQSITVPAGDYDYAITNPSPDDAVYIATNGRGSITLNEGAAYEFHVYYNGGETIEILVDDPNAPTVVENIGVEPAATSALVTWDDADDNVWNLRYREISSDPDAYYVKWDLNTEDQLDGWMIVDADGDGNNWGYSQPAEGDYCFGSASYINNTGALTPDNWVISPEVQLCGTLSFEAWGQDPSWAAEHFAVYVCTNPEWESVDEFVQISDEIVATGARTTYEFDLSSYEGAAGVFAIRHFNITDMFRLNVDNFVINNGPAPAEWNEIDGIAETQYNIEGLTPETTYEVQVQAGRDTEAAGAPAKAPSFAEWSESVTFTTLADEQTAIADVKTETETSNVWYNMAGMKLNGKPVEKGIYINGGKKVVVK